MRLAYQLLKTSCLLWLLAMSGHSLAVDTDNDGLPDDWDFIHLNVTNETEPLWISNCLIKLGGAWCCQAYGINSSMYDIYISELDKHMMPIDEITRNLHKSRGNSYATLPSIVVHHEGNYSTLRERNVEY